MLAMQTDEQRHNIKNAIIEGHRLLVKYGVQPGYLQNGTLCKLLYLKYGSVALRGDRLIHILQRVEGTSSLRDAMPREKQATIRISRH
ncbi:hypothetical protein [Nostoc sp.]|uniref:hypothetical protein n=1 Tax=Nostoc sp. TaxID=1180 RepID=UPI002FF49B80